MVCAAADVESATLRLLVRLVDAAHAANWMPPAMTDTAIAALAQSLHSADDEVRPLARTAAPTTCQARRGSVSSGVLQTVRSAGAVLRHCLRSGANLCAAQQLTVRPSLVATLAWLCASHANMSVRQSCASALWERGVSLSAPHVAKWLLCC